MKFLIGVGPIETVQRFFKKLRVEIPYDSAIPLLRYVSEENENINSKRYMHPKVHSSIIYYGQNREAA